jgi:hypothetical protein
VSSHFRRALGLTLVASGIALAVSCASGEDNNGVFNPPANDGSVNEGSRPDTSSGGSLGTGGSPSFGGSAGLPGTGGTSGTGNGGTGGLGGTTGTGGTGSGTCNANFCPTDPNGGTPCCMTPNGPCGIDNGTGCQSSGSTGGPDF